MANPLAVFRKHQKVLLAVFGVALMFVFTVGSIVSQYMYRANTDDQNQVVVTTKTESLRESDIQNLQFARHQVRSFMHNINQAAAEKGATPREGIGVPDTDAEADVVQTAILARQAQQAGIEVTDEAIINFLTRYSQDKLAKGDFARILQQISQGRMSQAQFFDAMRRELLAQRFITMFQRGILPPTPELAWEYFQRLNRRVSLEAVPFEVANYLARVEEPSEAQVQALYEKGKDRYPLPESPEPGFRQLRQVAVQYVKADLTTFLPAAKAQITDEQVKLYYEANREEFRTAPAATTSTPTATPDTATPDTATPDTATPDTATPDTATPDTATPDTATPDTATPDTATPDTATPDTATPDTATPDTATPDTATPDTATPDTTAPGTDQQPAGDGTVGATDSSAEEPVDAATADEGAAEEETGSEDTPAGETAAVDTEARQADPATEPSETPPADPLSELSAEAGETDPLAELPEAAGNNAGDAPVEFKPLEEVADEIRIRLATPIARQAMDQALNIVRGQMRAYFSAFLNWDLSPERDTTPQPAAPDLRDVATQQGLTTGTIPLVNVFQLQQTDPVSGAPLYEISRAYDTNFVPFAQHIFSDDLRMFEVRSIRGQVLDTDYLFWKTAEVAERVPPLADVRDQVVRAVKMQQARELAQQEAQQVADQLNQSRQRPRDAFANDPNRSVIDAPAVSWLTSMNVPYLPPRLTPIPGIEYPGDDFMRSVFSLEPGTAGIALDNPRDTVYVVAVTQVESDENQLRDQFLRTGVTPEIAMLAQRDSQRQLQNWYAGLEQELAIDWHRDPRPENRNQ